jgi:hypothetical protein
MELHTARQILDTLAQGIHPLTGEAMAEDSPYNAPPVIRALFAISQALEVKPGKAARGQPANAGKPWRPEDDEELEAGFTAGVDFKQLASDLGRTPFGVESRLVKLGKLAPRPGMRVSAPAAPAPV